MALCINDGICVIGDRNVINGNYIGLGVAGLVAFGNNGDGVDLKGDDNVVGGTAPGDRNVISANGNAGVLINGAGNRVEGNLIGLSANGTGAFGNGETGVSVSGDSNAIGGGGAGAGNVISNNGHGVLLGGSSNTVQGNLIGTNAAGTADRGNNLSGVLVAGVDNVVGGAPTARATSCRATAMPACSPTPPRPTPKSWATRSAPGSAATPRSPMISACIWGVTTTSSAARPGVKATSSPATRPTAWRSTSSSATPRWATWCRAT